MTDQLEPEEAGIAEVRRAAEEALASKPPPVEYHLTRRGLFIFSLLLGLALAGVVLLGIYGYFQFDSQNDDIGVQSDANALAIKRLDRVTKELKKITNPTPAQYRKALKADLERCLREPECRKLFPGIAKKANRGETLVPRGTSQRATQNGGSGSGSGGASPESGGNTGGTRPDKPSNPNKPGTGGGGSGGTTPTHPPAPTPAPTPEPTVDLNVPLVPPTCIGNIIHINCDRQSNGLGLGRDKLNKPGLGPPIPPATVHWLSFKVML